MLLKFLWIFLWFYFGLVFLNHLAAEQHASARSSGRTGLTLFLWEKGIQWLSLSSSCGLWNAGNWQQTHASLPNSAGQAHKWNSSLAGQRIFILSIIWHCCFQEVIVDGQETAAATRSAGCSKGVSYFSSAFCPTWCVQGWCAHSHSSSYQHQQITVPSSITCLKIEWWSQN